MGISLRIRSAIEARSLSLKEAAKVCDVSYSSLQNWISGIREPRPEALIALGSHLGISIDWLLTGEGSMFRGDRIEAGPSVNPDEEAILTLYRALGDSDKRELRHAAEEKRRLREMEQRLDDLTAALADIKKPA